MKNPHFDAVALLSDLCGHKDPSVKAMDHGRPSSISPSRSSSDSERIEPLIGFHEDILRQLFARLTIAENRRGTPPLHSPKRCVVIGFRVG